MFLDIGIFKLQDSTLSLKGQNVLPRSICNAGGVPLGWAIRKPNTQEENSRDQEKIKG